MSMNEEDLLSFYRSQVAPPRPTGTPTKARLLPPSKPIVYEGGAKKNNQEDDGGGLFQNLVVSPISWVASNVAAAPKFAISAAKTLGNLSQGRMALTGVQVTKDWQEAQKQGLSGLDQFYYATSGELPLVSQLSQGIITSGGNLAELATAGKFDVGEEGINYANAYRRGDLGGVILDDLGNLVLVGRGAGAGNVVSRGGSAVTRAGAPRLGRTISATGRFVEEPIGTTARTAARVATPVAGRLGRPILSERLARVGQAGVGNTAGPFRQALVEANDAITTRAESRLGRVNQQIADLDRQLEANPSDAGRIAADRLRLKRKQEGLTRLTGLVKNIRLFTRQRQVQEEQRRASFVSEGLRLKERGPSVEFDGAPEGPIPEFAEKVANLILTGRLDAVVREIEAGTPIETIMQSINPSGIGPDLARAGYAFTLEDIQKALEYAAGQLSDFDRLSVDAVVNFLTRFSNEFTAGQLSGEYRLGGPMPETYTRRFPLVEFLFNEIDRGRFRQSIQIQMLSFLDTKTVDEVISQLDEETLAENNITATAENPLGAFRQLYEVPKGSELEGVAQMWFEVLEPELMQRFPEIMRNPMIYPSPMRPEMMFEARLLRAAKASDIGTILTGLNALVEQYGDLLGKGTVASLIANLENIVGTPLENTPGAYNQVTAQLKGIRNVIAQRIESLQNRAKDLTDEQRTIVSDLIDAEARLGAAEATLRTVAQTYDAIQPIFDEAQAQSQQAVQVARSQQDTVLQAIDAYRRSQAELQLQDDPRQQLVDEIDEAVRLAEGLEYADNLDTLIDEFEFRQREVEAGKVDPTTVEPKPFTNRSKEVKAAHLEMIRQAQEILDLQFGRLELDYQTGPTISWNAWARDTNMTGMTLRDMVINEFARYMKLDEAERLADSWADQFVYDYDPFDINNDRGVGVNGMDDWVEIKRSVEGGSPDGGTSRADVPQRVRSSGETARDDEWSGYLEAFAQVYLAEQKLKQIKKLRLYEVADEMNRDRSSRDFTTSGYTLPVLARAIAYATNPNLLTADLNLRDRYVNDMESGIPYEGAQPRLIPIPKNLEEQAALAERTVDRQQAQLDRLRDRSVADQQKELKAQLKGVGKIVVEGEPPTATGALLVGARTRMENQIQQYINKLENRRVKLEEVKARHAAEQALLDETGAVAQEASAVEQYLQRPVGAQLFAEGVTPRYLPTGLPASARPGTRVRTELSGEGAAPQVTPFSEQMRTSDEMPLTLATTIERINELLNVTGRNKIIDDIVLDPEFARRAGSFVTPEQLVEIYEQARAEVEAQPQRRTPAEIEKETEKLASVKLSRIVRDAGYEPVSRIKIDPETGAHEAMGDLLRTVRDDEVAINTIVMRQGVRERITQQFKVKDATDQPEGFARFVDKIGRATGQWKSVVLPFRISWQTGDAVSNVLNAWVRAEVPPQQLVDRMREVDKALSDQSKRLESLTGSIKDPLIATLIAYGLQARGLRDAEIQQLRGIGDPRQVIPDYEFRRIAPKFREKSFRFNEYQNTVARVATAIEILTRTLAEQGRSIDDVTPSNVRQDPVLRKAVEDVVKSTNEALGAFSDMSPFEKNAVRNIYPFWSWIRYINKAAVQLAIDSPDRVLFTIALGALVADEEQSGLFPFLEGRVPLLGYYFDLSFLNPYQDTILFSANPVKALLDQATNISPVLSTPLQAAAITGTYASGMRFPILPNPSRPSYLEGGKGASTRTWGDYFGELGYVGLQNFGGPFRSSLTMLPSEFENIPAPIRTQLLSRFPGLDDTYGAIFPEGRIRGTDVAIGNVQRFPQGSQRTTGRYSVERLGPVASRLSALLGVVGIPRPLIEEDVALQQARLQTIADIEAQQRRERERTLSRIGQ
jgi:hypothetical protein